MTYRRIAALFAALALLGGCAVTAAPYAERMAFLDRMTEEGIKYRGELLKQGTQISQEACDDGYELLNPNLPYDDSPSYHSPKWEAQVKEAYVKGCLTGLPRPKPEPSGAGAVTVVPHSSVGAGVPASPAPSVSG